MSKKQIKEWCSATETVSSLVAQDPSKSVGEIADGLYKKKKLDSALAKVGIRKHPESDEPTKEDLDWAASCGKFDERPSDLFLKIYSNVLETLEGDPLAGLVSPPLLGSTGTIPLSIISVIPDQMRHYANCIIRVEHEACIATNFIEQSNSSKLIANALRELSKRHEGKGKKVVVKFMYDRGSGKQLVENHQLVPPEQWPDVDLPKEEEIPNIDMQIVNFHRPVVGTFHTKMAVFDRKIALLSSCNMQDRVNVEMTVHIEGNAVDSFYDVFLLSWDKKLEPALPLANRPAATANHHGNFGKDHDHINDIDVEATTARSRKALKEQHDEMNQGGTGEKAAEKHAGEAHQSGTDKTATGDYTAPTDADNQAEMSNHLSEMDLKDKGPSALASHLDVAGPNKAEATTKDPVDDFSPVVLHAEHKPFPIAMVNRRPHGRPGHGDTKCPQDAAWLAGFKFAQRKVFIQTPTYTADDAVKACVDACKRGIHVTLWLDLGFNDEGEIIPRQGPSACGTNEMNVTDMYKELHKHGKADNLEVYWYTAKDQAQPLNASEKKRNCHVKFASYDDEVAMVGNGNQDTQSWYHSQEINVLVDSKEVVAEWHKALAANQNTGKHGKVDNDGIYRNPDGSAFSGLADHRKGPVEGITKGVGGAIARARGTGGF